MQIATTTKTVFYSQGSWIVFLATIVIGVIAAFVLYSYDRFSLIYYADSVSHLVRAREFVDAINPGLFEQLGTAWLPLPHLLLLPFTLIEPLFKTGFAGAALNIPCLAFTSVFLYKIIKSHLNVGFIAIVGAFLYVTNPNILYMSVTPMTEASFMLFFVGAAYFFMKWMSGPRKYLSLNSVNEGNSTSSAGPIARGVSPNRYGQSSHVLLYLIMCSAFISLATLCRYEAWILPIFFVPFVVINTLRKQRYYHSRKYELGIILISFLSFSGIALWLLWNTYAYNDPLEFTNAPYFSAAAQALERSNRAFLYLQPWNVISLYGVTALAIYGPILLATAVIGYLLHRHLGKSEERRKRRNLYLFLAMPPLFTLVSLLVGIGEMNQTEWFNSRFVIILAPLIISLCCVFLARFPPGFKKYRYAFPLTIFILFVYQFLTPGLGVVTFLNANYQFDGSRPFQIQTAEALASTYDGISKIVIITGSSQHNKIMQASGIPLRQFDQILESGSYKDSFKEPWLHSKYIILGKKPDPSANNVANYWLERQPLLEKYYDTIYQDKYYKMMELSDGSTSSLSDSSLASDIGQSDFRITPESDDNLLLHSHVHLNVTLDGKHITIPANIGIDPKLHKDNSLDIYGPQKSPLHTHTTSGTVHVESRIIANYTLGEFLNVWGLPIAGKTVNMTTNGIPVADFRNQILNDGDYINLALCSNATSATSSRC